MDTSAVYLIQLGFNLCRFYLAIGLVFSVLFVIFWVGRVDHAAQRGLVWITAIHLIAALPEIKIDSDSTIKKQRICRCG